MHIHSTTSDGRPTPSEVVFMALERGLEVSALTDYDAVLSGAGAEGGVTSSSVMEGLLTLLLSNKLGVQVSGEQRERTDRFFGGTKNSFRRNVGGLRRN